MTSHLHPDTAAVLEMPAPDRIAFAQTDRWIGYTRAQQVIRQLDDLMIYPQSLRMPNVLLVARSDNGKSAILHQFVKRHPVIEGDDGRLANSVLWFPMPATPTQSSFWSEILYAMLIAHRQNDPPEKKRRQVIDALQYANVRIIAIDEFNHLTNAGKEAPRLLAAIKNLGTALRIPIVAAGTQVSIAALNSDPQLKFRFEPAVLDRWTLNSEYLRFLKSYETFLPLPEPSDLASRELATKLYAMGGDAIGGTVKVLKRAAAFAVQHGYQSISMRVLQSMEQRSSVGWDDAASRA